MNEKLTKYIAEQKSSNLAYIHYLIDSGILEVEDVVMLLKSKLENTTTTIQMLDTNSRVVESDQAQS